jgi:putative drug exporter of the RND superfamily
MTTERDGPPGDVPAVTTEPPPGAAAGADNPPGGSDDRWWSSGRHRWRIPAAALALFLFIAAPLASVGSKLSDVQRNDSSSYLPDDGEATRALAASKRFTGLETTPAIVVYTKTSGTMTRQDQVAMVLIMINVRGYYDTMLATPPIGPTISDDGKAAQVIINFVGSDPREIRPAMTQLWLMADDAPGLEVHIGGPAAALADLTEVFGAVDGVLLAVTAALVLLILIVVYRSPILPFVVLAVAGTALSVAQGTSYLLAKSNVVTVSGDAQGILGVLVLGAATDYALLLVARYREELRRREDRYEAMWLAWKAAVPPVLASGGTVILGLLCLLVSGLPSTRGLGPVSAIGIASALLSMLVMLPALLALLGRWAFWPFRPHVAAEPATAVRPGAAADAAPGGAQPAATGPSATRGIWGWIAATVGRRPRLVWGLTALTLGVLALGMFRLEAHGVPRTESFLAPAGSVTAQRILGEHFPEAAGTPAVIVARADRLDQVVAAVHTVPGVTEVEPYVDPLERYNRRLADQPPPGPMVVDGRVRVDATFSMPADSPRAREVIRQLREAVRAIPGSEALVGGYTAANLDVQETAQRDRLIIIPLVLIVVLAVLIGLLRAVVIPLILVATVALSFLATLGVSGVVFRDVLGFAGADSSLPLFAFVFLVALGVDYNIFLMTRVREEVAGRGHRAGTLTGLAITGGVITSAGVVLAATFAMLSVLPLVFLAELAFAVSFGVLLDALVVRSLLVPALTVDIGRKGWWPGPLQNADP